MNILKVCKSCGKSGLFLHLNSDLLCDDCANFEKSQMSMSQVADTLASVNLSKIKEYNRTYDRIKARETKNFEAIYKKFEKAKKLEKAGEVDKALDVYLGLLSYLPPGTLYYTRPCIILEKKRDYSTAIEICDLAIKCIKEKRFNADIAEFQHRKERLISKNQKINHSSPNTKG